MSAPRLQKSFTYIEAMVESTGAPVLLFQTTIGEHTFTSRMTIGDNYGYMPIHGLEKATTIVERWAKRYGYTVEGWTPHGNQLRSPLVPVPEA